MKIFKNLNLSKFKEIIENNIDLIRLVDINTPEITLELAQKLLYELYSQIEDENLLIYEDIDIIPIADNYVALKYIINIVDYEKNKPIFKIVEVGEARSNNEYIIRYAYARALKRIIDKILGDRIINQTLIDLYNQGKLDHLKEKFITNNQLDNLNTYTQYNQNVINNNPFHTVNINPNVNYITDKQLKLIYSIAGEKNKLAILDQILNTVLRKPITQLTSKQAALIIEFLLNKIDYNQFIEKIKTEL